MSQPSSIIFFAAKSAIMTGMLLVALYGIAFSWLVYAAPMPYRELDRNHDGEVSFDEASYAASFGKRTIQVNGQHCIEYFAYKDGLSLKMVCGSRL